MTADMAFMGSAEIDGQRIIMVINGLSSSAERKMESVRLMNLAFRTYQKYDILKEAEAVGNAPVYMGVEASVDLLPAEPYTRVLNRKSHSSMSTRTNWPKPVNAPITKGQEIGEVFITIDGVEKRIALVAANDVDELPLHRRIGAFFKYLIFGSESVQPQ